MQMSLCNIRSHWWFFVKSKIPCDWLVCGASSSRRIVNKAMQMWPCYTCSHLSNYHLIIFVIGWFKVHEAHPK